MVPKSMPLRRRGWIPVFGKGLSPRMRGSCSTNNVEWDDESKISHPALHYWWSMIPEFAGTSLFRKPVSTFRDHALSHHLMQPPSGRAVGQEPGGSFAKVRRQSIFRSNGSEYALLLLRWRMFLSENRYPLFRNMRQPHSVAGSRASR